jgi:hypothetical protein
MNMVGFSLILLIKITVFLLLSVVNMDDCWQWSRDAQGTIQPEPTTFPSGIPALADYVHSKKLKFGLYSGTKLPLFIYY